MSKKIEQGGSKADTLMWVLVLLLLAGGVAGNYYFTAVAMGLRAAGWLVLVLVVIAMISQTQTGRRLWAFSMDARNEMRKVVWPTRQETIQSTALVATMCVLTAVLLWGVDALLLWAVGFLTGQRG